MFSILYLIFVHPIELVIKIILETALKITGSYGFSLIIVSLVISIVTHPLYKIAEHLKNKEKRNRDKMQPMIDDLKSVYKGYELHLYLNALYRQHKYHPLQALQSSLGLLIQIPFFIAAYHFLSSFELLNGASFWIFNDLGNPDGLIKISGLNINILPVIMTVFNLSGAWYYGKNSSLNERIQMYLVAFLFLILLYHSPSGLLIYWTCNNFFTFIKYLVNYYIK